MNGLKLFHEGLKNAFKNSPTMKKFQFFVAIHLVACNCKENLQEILSSVMWILKRILRNDIKAMPADMYICYGSKSTNIEWDFFLLKGKMVICMYGIICILFKGKMHCKDMPSWKL